MSDLVKDTSERDGGIEKIQMEFELQMTLLEHQVIQKKETGIFCCKVIEFLFTRLPRLT